MDVVTKAMLKDQALAAVAGFQTELEGASESFRDGDLLEGLKNLEKLFTDLDQFGKLYTLALNTAISPLNVPETPPSLANG